MSFPMSFRRMVLGKMSSRMCFLDAKRPLKMVLRIIVLIDNFPSEKCPFITGEWRVRRVGNFWFIWSQRMIFLFFLCNEEGESSQEITLRNSPVSKSIVEFIDAPFGDSSLRSLCSRLHPTIDLTDHVVDCVHFFSNRIDKQPDVWMRLLKSLLESIVVSFTVIVRSVRYIVDVPSWYVSHPIIGKVFE